MPRPRKLQDGRARSWWWMENRAVDDLWIAYVGVYAWAVYCVLVRHADDRGRAFPSASEIASITGISLREVRKSLKLLLGCGLIRRTKKGSPTTPSVYQVREIPETKNHTPKNDPRPAPPTPKPEPVVASTVEERQRDATTAFLSSLGEEEPDPEPEPEPKKTPKAQPKSKLARRLPEDWKPNETHTRIAKEEGVDLEREVILFRDHAEATGRRMLDWHAAFRTWLRNARNFNREYYRNGGGSSSPEQRAKEEVASFYENEPVV